MVLRKLAKLCVALVLVLAGAVFANTVAVSGDASAAECSNAEFLGFRPWYYGLTYMSGDSCEIRQPVAGSAAGTSSNTVELSAFIWTIVFNIMDIILNIIRYAAVVFVLIGGFSILTSSGDPGKVSKGKMTIANALLGVVITLVGAGVVRFINDTLLGAGATQSISILEDGSLEGSGFASDVTENGVWLRAVGAFMQFAIIGAVLMVAWGGIKLSMSSGDPTAAAKAKNTIIFAVIGAVLMIAARLIVQIAVTAATG
jgi:hypothetical protein